MNQSMEFRVGLLTLLALSLFIWLVVKVEDYQPFQDTYRIGVTFHDVQRLLVGDAVRLNGLPVGKVRAMSLKDGLVLTWLEIEKQYSISREARISVGTAGFFGANYIKISQPIVKDRETAQYLQPEEVIAGHEEAGLDRMVEQGQRMMASLRVTVDALNKILADSDFREDIKDSADNLRLASKRMEEMLQKLDGRVEKIGDNLVYITDDLKGSVEENRPAVRRALEDLERLSADMREITHENREDVRALVANLRDFTTNLHDNGRTAERLKEVLARLDGLVLDYGSGGKIGGELARSAENFTTITEDLKKVSGKARDIVEDPKTGEQVEQVVTDVHELNEQSKEFGSLLDKFGVDLRTNTLYNVERETFRNDVHAYLSYDDQYFAILGHEEIGPSQGVNTVQGGFRFWDDFIARSGWFRDKYGFGVDYQFDRRKAMLSVEIFDEDKGVGRAIGRYRINDSFNMMVRQERVNKPDSHLLLGVESHF